MRIVSKEPRITLLLTHAGINHSLEQGAVIAEHFFKPVCIFDDEGIRAACLDKRLGLEEHRSKVAGVALRDPFARRKRITLALDAVLDRAQHRLRPASK